DPQDLRRRPGCRPYRPPLAPRALPLARRPAQHDDPGLARPRGPLRSPGARARRPVPEGGPRPLRSADSPACLLRLAQRNRPGQSTAFHAVIVDGDLAVALHQEKQDAGREAVDAGHHQPLGTVLLNLDLVEVRIVDEAARDNLPTADR